MEEVTAKIINLLKAKRSELAKQLNQEPFKILHNETIEHIAEARPRTRQELLSIKGIGPKKADQFGEIIFSTLKEALGDNSSSNEEEKVLSVAEFLNSLNVVLHEEKRAVSGEIFGAVNRRGNANYFKLKDKKEEAVLECFAWQFVLDRIGIDLEEGMMVQVVGYPEIWKPTGRLSFKAEELLLSGEGVLKKAFEALKKKLVLEGLFDTIYKKPLPKFPERIGLVTARGREAQTDFLTHLVKRGLQVFFYDVRVEGAHAIDQIVEAIQYFNQYRQDIQVLVLTRGGGGLESLQAFNSEAVARTIFASKIPIVSGVGHEKDVTMADLVADVRASTPTHAAKIISEDWEKAPIILQRFKENLFTRYIILIQEAKRTALELWLSIQREFEHALALNQAYLVEVEKKLHLADPEFKLKQGFSIVSREDRKTVVKSVDQLKVGDKIKVRFYKGEAGSRVETLEADHRR